MDKLIPHVDPPPPEAPGGVDAVHEQVPMPPVLPEPPVAPHLEGDVPPAVAERDPSPQEGRTSDATDNPPESDDPE